jgi:5-methylcytosine-specific restriction endonuclease McrA
MQSAFTRHVPQRVRFSRSNVLARDGFACQYCGTVPRNREGRPMIAYLTLDHVVPRAQARAGQVSLPWNGRRVALTSWENVVASCKECNRRKGDRTPDQAGMRLFALPYRPSAWDVVRIAFGRSRVPDEWHAFLPEDLTKPLDRPRAASGGWAGRRR